MKHKALTVWELLIVVAIVAIGAAILMPLPHHTREGARRSSCQSNLKQIGLAFLQYAQDADAKAPPVAGARGGWTLLLAPYLKNPDIFQCPSAYSGKIGSTDYFFNARLAGARGKLGAHAKPPFTILSGDGADDANSSSHLSQFPDSWRKDENSPAWRHLDGANYGFIDGHVKWFKPEKIFGAPEAATSQPSSPIPTFEMK